MIKAFDQIKNLLLVLIVAFSALIVPQKASAERAPSSLSNIQQKAEDIQATFQDALIKASKKDDQNMSDLIPLMGFLMVINVFSCLYKSGPDKLLVEMSKMGVWAFIAMCVMGGSFYKSTRIGDMFTVHTTVCGREFNHDGGGSLDRDILNYFKYATDQLACGLYKEDVNSKYNRAVTDMFMIIQTSNNIPEKCFSDLQGNVDGSGQQSVLKCVREQKALEVAKKAETCTWAMNASGACVLQKFFDVLENIMTGKAVIVFIVVILQVVVQVVQFMVLFSMIIGIVGSLLMFKLIAPFFVLESTRGKVLAAAKIPLAIALYGFTHKTLLFFLTTLIDAVSEASLISFEKFRGEGAIGGTMYVYIIVCIACLAILSMQIVAIMRVPKIAMNLVDLSLKELVNIGGEMMKAAFGMSLALATAGAGVAGVAMSGGMAAVTGAARGAGRALGGFGPKPDGPGGAGSGMVNRGGRSRYPGAPESNGAVGNGMLPKSEAAQPMGNTQSEPRAPTSSPATAGSEIPLRNDPKKSEPTKSNVVHVSGSTVHVTGPNAAVQEGQSPITSGRKVVATNDTGVLKGASNESYPDISVGSGSVSAQDGQPIDGGPGSGNAANAGDLDKGNDSESRRGSSRSRRNTEGTGVASDDVVSDGLPGGGGSNTRSRKGQQSSGRDAALSRAKTFNEYEQTKARFDKDDSPAMARKKSNVDKFYGTFGSKQGRRDLAKAVVSGGGSFIKGIMLSAMDGPGSELNVTGAFSAGKAGIEQAFDQGEKRYAEFRESIESVERQRSSLVETGLDAANHSESMANDVLSDAEFTDLISNLDGIIGGVLDKTTELSTLQKLGAGVRAQDPKNDAILQDKHQQALQASRSYASQANAMKEDSERFSKVVSFMAKKAELTNEDIENLMEVLALPIKAEAIAVYTSNKARLELLMRAKLLKDTNTKVK